MRHNLHMRPVSSCHGRSSTRQELRRQRANMRDVGAGFGNGLFWVYSGMVFTTKWAMSCARPPRMKVEGFSSPGCSPRLVIPAHAGIQVCCAELAWIPAFAGMTEPRQASSFSSPNGYFQRRTRRARRKEDFTAKSAKDSGPQISGQQPWGYPSQCYEGHEVLVHKYPKPSCPS